jgi:hypothetical protein
MTRSSLIAIAIAFGLVGTAPSVSLATDLAPRQNLEATKQTIKTQNRWLRQFGANAHVDPLCSQALSQTTQVLSSSSCLALSRFQVAPIRIAARSVRVAHIKRDRAFWNALSRRDQRILEQYEVVVVGDAPAVDAKTGGAR